jgi:predicted nicotinamide N-methyase
LACLAFQMMTQYKTQEKKLLLVGRPVTLRIIKDPDSLLDGELHSDKVPYWAELWPSALVLSSYIAGLRLRGEAVLELGCGLGLTTIAISYAGGVPLAIDYDPDALRFAQHNLQANHGYGAFARMDWSALALSCSFPYIVAADILYDRDELPKIGKLLQHYLQRGGQIMIAEPGRGVAQSFFQSLSLYGLYVIQKIPSAIDRVTIWKLGKK